MEQLKDTVFKFKEKKYIKDIIITLFILVLMLTTFYFSVVGGAPNLIAFIIVVIICFIVISLFLAKHIYLGIVMMVVGGFFGFITDFWGTGNNVFQYIPETITFAVLISGELGNGGVPFEIVASYFFCSMWLVQVVESLFEREIEELIEEYDSGSKLIKSYKQMLPAIIVIIISIIMISTNLLLIQPWTFFSIGVFLTCLVPGTKKIIPIMFGIIVGFSGLLFELFCSGEIFQDVYIWIYIEPDWSFEHTYRAIIAYAGFGATFSSLALLLLKYPVFRKEITLIKIKKD